MAGGECYNRLLSTSLKQEYLVVRERSNAKATLLGVGLDNKDEQVRITRGENFNLVGGSKETHESMQEKCLKLNEKLTARGKTLDDLEHREFLDLAEECQMRVAQARKRE